MTNAMKPREPSGKLDVYDWHNNSLNQARADLPTRHIYHDERQGKKCRNWPTSPKPKPADNRQIATDKQAKGKIRGKEMAKWMRARLGR